MLTEPKNPTTFPATIQLVAALLPCGKGLLNGYHRISRAFLFCDASSEAVLECGYPFAGPASITYRLSFGGHSKAPAIEEQFIAYWEDLLAGNDADAKSRWDTARRLAASKGCVYKPIEDLASGPIEDLLARLEVISAKGELSPPNVVSAVLGNAEAPRPVLSTVAQEFFELTRDRLKGKSPEQIKRWQNPRLRAVRNFIKQIADKPIGNITREDALAFRSWWADRVEGGMEPSSANKDFGHLSDLFRT